MSQRERFDQRARGSCLFRESSKNEGIRKFVPNFLRDTIIGYRVEETTTSFFHEGCNIELFSDNSPSPNRTYLRYSTGSGMVLAFFTLTWGLMTYVSYEIKVSK